MGSNEETLPTSTMSSAYAEHKGGMPVMQEWHHGARNGSATITVGQASRLSPYS